MNRKNNINSKYSFINYYQIEKLEQKYQFKIIYDKFQNLYTLYSSNTNELNNIINKLKDLSLYDYTETSFNNIYEKSKDASFITNINNAADYYKTSGSNHKQIVREKASKIYNELLKTDIKLSFIKTKTLSFTQIKSNIDNIFKLYLDNYAHDNDITNNKYPTCFTNSGTTDKKHSSKQAYTNCYNNISSLYNNFKPRIYNNIQEELYFYDTQLNDTIEYVKTLRLSKNIEDNIISILNNQSITSNYTYEQLVTIINTIRNKYINENLLCVHGTGNGKKQCNSIINTIFNGIINNVLKGYVSNTIADYIKNKYTNETNYDNSCLTIVNNNKELTLYESCIDNFKEDILILNIRTDLLNITYNNNTDIINTLNAIRNNYKNNIFCSGTTSCNNFIDTMFNDVIENIILQNKLFEDIEALIDDVQFYLDSNYTDDNLQTTCSDISKKYNKKNDKNNSRNICNQNLPQLINYFKNSFELPIEINTQDETDDENIMNIEDENNFNIQPDTTSTQVQKDEINISQIPNFMINDPDFIYGKTTVNNTAENIKETNIQFTNNDIIIGIIILYIIISYFITKK